MPFIKHPQSIKEHIKCYLREDELKADDYHAEGLERLNQAEKSYFWFIARREYIIRLFKQYVNKSKQCLEIGAGTGFIAKGIAESGYNISVSDIHLSGLKYSKHQMIQNYYQFDIFDSPVKDEFDVICLFDVLEHLSDDIQAVTQISTMLKSKGMLILTVPAHQWLWNRDDQIADHKRRYNKKTLERTITASGLKIVHIKYFFIIIVPLLLIRRFVNKGRNDDISIRERKSDIKINSLLNTILLMISRLEIKLSPWLPNITGGSLIVVALKD